MLTSIVGHFLCSQNSCKQVDQSSASQAMGHPTQASECPIKVFQDIIALESECPTWK